MMGPNRTEWPFSKDLFPKMPGTPLPGAGDGLHGNFGVSEGGRGGTNNFLLLEGGAEEARRRDGKSMGDSGGQLCGPQW